MESILVLHVTSCFLRLYILVEIFFDGNVCMRTLPSEGQERSIKNFWSPYFHGSRCNHLFWQKHIIEWIDKGLNHTTSGERKACIEEERKSSACAVKVPARIRNLSRRMEAGCITTELDMCSQIPSITASQISHSIWQHSLNQKFKIVIVNNKRKH